MRGTLPRIRGTPLIRAGLVIALVLSSACSDDDPPRDAAPKLTDIGPCDWPMWGHDIERSFATSCEAAITVENVESLALEWSFTSRDVVTASPAVVGDTVYVGDWSGRFYALDVETGDERWTFDADVHPTVYSGQIVSSAAVADARDGRRLVLFAGGRTMYALDARTGEEQWRHDVNPNGDERDSSEIQSSPVVVDGLVVFGFDGHDRPGVRAGVKALDLASGEERWYFDPDEGGEPAGCAGVWGSPSIDLERHLVLFGTANCVSSPDGWGPYTEALVAVELDTGEPVWSYQPHDPNNDDFDFAGAPNLFSVDGVDAAGLGSKDGHYYAVERATGDPLWDVEAAESRVQGRNFSTGGFIGGTAVSGDTIVGGTAIGGDCPCLHAITTDGELRWQQTDAGPTYASAAATSDLVFVGSTTDFTLRAVRLSDGEVMWSTTMPGAVAGGVAITAERVVAVAGIREPGNEGESQRSGVSSFTLREGGRTTTTPTSIAPGLPPTTAAPPPGAEPPSVPGDPRPCVGSPCILPFTLREPPAGTTPGASLHVRPSPFRLEVRTEGLGDPSAWLRPGSPAAEKGAVAYGVFISVSDDDPTGSLLCILDTGGDCVTEALPDPLAGSYNRISILAIADSVELPDQAEGFDRLVTTQDFNPRLDLG